jgi:hypothetical protein
VSDDGVPSLPAGPGSGEGATVPARRLSEDEVSAILRRAADVDARADLPSGRDSTLEDLMRAAEEVGLDPAEVRRAAAVLPPSTGGVAAAVFGAPDRREVRSFLQGARLPEARQDLVRASESAMGRAGEVVDSDPRRFLWQETHLGGRTRVELVETDAGTEIRVSSDRAGHYLGRWFSAFMAWAALSALTPLGSLGPAVAVLGFLIAPIVLARPFWKRADAVTRRRLDRVVMDAMRVVDAGAGGR